MAARQHTLDLTGGAWYPSGYADAKWRPPAMSDLPSSWAGIKRIGLDTETFDPDIKTLGPGVRRDGRMIGISFAIEDGPKFYLPFGHEGDNLDAEQVINYFQHQFKTYDGEVVGMNLPYDLDYMWDADIKMPMVKRFLDVGVADPLIYELHMKYSLDEILKRRGFAGKNEELLRKAAAEYGFDPKADMWQMPARFCGPYAEDDAAEPLLVLRKQERDIEDLGLQASWDMECKVLPILVRMTRRGIRVDVDRLDRIDQWTRDEERAALDDVKHRTGVFIPVNETKDAALTMRAMQAAGLPTCDGVKKATLEAMKHPVAAALARARQMDHLRTTFVNSVRRHLVNGDMMHCTFNQIRRTNDDSAGEDSGVAFGRLSAEHVNMQQQPSLSRSPPNDETGAIWRSIYKTPTLGKYWASLDLKQQEPKWTYHFAKLAELKGADEVIAKFQANPLMDSYMPIVELTGVSRGTAKIVWLSYTYGKSDGNLCFASPPFGLGLPTWPAVWDRNNRRHESAESERGLALRQSGSFVYKRPGPEGQAIIDKINEGAPFLRALQKLAQKRAGERGYITLLSGRRCNFETFGENGGYKDLHAALNRLIQGQAAEQTKLIMIAVSDAGYDDTLLLQVHDELDNEVDDKPQAMAIAEVMRTAVPMLVPTVVDVEIGPSWGESMSVEYDQDGKQWKKQYEWGLT